MRTSAGRWTNCSSLRRAAPHEAAGEYKPATASSPELRPRPQRRAVNQFLFQPVMRRTSVHVTAQDVRAMGDSKLSDPQAGRFRPPLIWPARARPNRHGAIARQLVTYSTTSPGGTHAQRLAEGRRGRGRGLRRALKAPPRKSLIWNSSCRSSTTSTTWWRPCAAAALVR